MCLIYHKCDQMAILFTQFLANYNIENLPKNFVKIVTNYVQYLTVPNLKREHKLKCDITDNDKIFKYFAKRQFAKVYKFGPCFLHLLFCKLGHSSMCADDELGLCKVLCNLADTTNYDIRQWVFCSL